MESGRFARALLAAIVGAGVWAGLARAQDCPVPAYHGPTIPYMIQQAPVAFAPAPAPATPPPFIVEYHPQFQGPVWIPPDLFDEGPNPPRKHKWCCYATINSVGCGSLKAECTYIFGSCRKFYGEPCYPKPAGSSAYGGYGPGRAGCSCP